MSTPEELEKARRNYNSYLRYTGLGFSMIGIVLFGAWGGWYLDGVLNWKYPVFTIALSLLGIVGAMVYLFKETGKQ